MYRDVADAGVSRNAADHVIFDTTTPGARVTGRIVAEGIVDELPARCRSNKTTLMMVKSGAGSTVTTSCQS